MEVLVYIVSMYMYTPMPVQIDLPVAKVRKVR